MTELLTLQNAVWQVGILPTTGASVAFGRIAADLGDSEGGHAAAQAGGAWVDVMRPTDEAAYGVADDTSSYVLSPWSNRIRDGLLRFRGETYQLARWFNDGTAIHGTAKAFPWRVLDADDTSARLAFTSADVVGSNWPWRFSTEIRYELSGNRFSTHTTVTNDDEKPFPVGFGHHPHFLRGLGQEQDEAQVQIPCELQFELERCMPSGPPVPVQERLDFRQLRPLGERFIDDNLTGRVPGAPIVIDYPRSGRRLTLHFDEVYANVVFYVPQEGKNFFAVEPVTNANDGFNLFEAGIEGSGIQVLEPGASLSGNYHLDATAG